MSRASGREQGSQPRRLDSVEDAIDPVYRFLLGMTGDPEAAADLTQDTFLKIYRAGRNLSDVGLSAALVFTIARNTAFSRFRRLRLERKHLVALTPDEDKARLWTANSPTENTETRELRDALRTALRSLNPDLRAVFLLSEVEGLKYAEIAEILGCAPGTVGSRKHAAVNKLRNELRRLGHAL